MIKFGATRMVLFLPSFSRRYPRGVVVKLPRPTHWRLFLHGLLGNMQEAEFSKAGWKQLCPVLFSLPGGFLVVMPRCQVFQGKLSDRDYQTFVNQPNYCVPVENKAGSFGYYRKRLVAIDYGS